MPLPDFLIDRYIHWRDHYFKINKLKYKKTVIEGQKPKVMVISCCDSRIHATSIFRADIGEFFIHRNIANLVPSYKSDDDHDGTSAAIEYAVKTLKVKHIIILGHSNCGGIDYAYKSFFGKASNKYEFLDQWLAILKPLFQKIANTKAKNTNINFFEKESIKNSYINLINFPFVNDLIKQNKISIHGLWHDIEAGKLMELNSDNNDFKYVIYE